MAKRDQKDSTGRTVAIIGGGALLAWLLLRGKGWTFDTGDGDSGASGSGDGTGATATAPAAPLPPCRVHIGKTGLRLDGGSADLASTVARCRAAGTAEVTAAGDAIVRVVAETMHALQDAGITVKADPGLWSAARSVPRKP